MNVKSAFSLQIDTPWASVLHVECDGEIIVASRFGSRRAARPHLKPAAVLREAKRQVDAYFRKRLQRFDLPLRFDGTPFQVRVWEFVARLEVGELISYGDLARAVDRPRAHRGVARAMAQTRLDLFVPAHRVVGGDGSVRGAGPYSMRRRLLLFEGIRLR
jgi:methylated-DNA-[protein]-cysteine S-methyltransferase